MRAPCLCVFVRYLAADFTEACEIAPHTPTHTHTQQSNTENHSTQPLLFIQSLTAAASLYLDHPRPKPAAAPHSLGLRDLSKSYTTGCSFA